MSLTQSRLPEPERALWRAFSLGRVVDLRAGDTQADDPQQGGSWPGHRTVRAETISALLRGAADVEPGRTPALRLLGARIPGRLDLSFANISAPIFLEDCWLEQPPELTEATTRSIWLLRSWLPGFNGDFARCQGQLNLDHTVVTGRVRLVMAHITGELKLRGTRITNPGDWGLYAGGLKVEGALFGSSPFRSIDRGVLAVDGGIRLVGASLMGGLFMDGVQLRNPSGDALAGDNLHVSDRMHCRHGFVAEGAVRLAHARIDGEASFVEASLNADGVALLLAHAEVRELDLRTTAPIQGLVDLRHSRCAVLKDRPAAAPPRLALDGFEYDAIASDGDASDDGVAVRLHWLMQDPDGYRPQPYEHLAALYRRLGNDEDARRVRLAKERRRRASLSRPGRLLGRLLDWTVGYGYRPWRAAAWLAALLSVGTITFSLRRPQPASESAPHFDPTVYTLDLLLPIGAFGLQDEFVPDGATRWLVYGLSTAGWLLATALVAGVTRVIKTRLERRAPRAQLQGQSVCGLREVRNHARRPWRKPT